MSTHYYCPVPCAMGWNLMTMKRPHPVKETLPSKEKSKPVCMCSLPVCVCSLPVCMFSLPVCVCSVCVCSLPVCVCWIMAWVHTSMIKVFSKWWCSRCGTTHVLGMVQPLLYHGTTCVSNTCICTWMLAKTSLRSWEPVYAGHVVNGIFVFRFWQAHHQLDMDNGDEQYISLFEVLKTTIKQSQVEDLFHVHTCIHSCKAERNKHVTCMVW